MTAGQEYAEIEVMKMVTCLYSTASGMYVYVCVMHLLLYVCMYIIYLCMYVCMYIFMYVCMYVYMYVCMYIFMYVCMYVCMYIFMYVCMYVYMYVYIYVCTYVYMYVCMYACMYVCMYIFMYVCMYVFMYVCMYIYVCMYVFMYVFMHVCMYKYNYICVNNYRLHYTRQPGAILHPGTQVARLELDDPSSIKQANKFCGTLPTMSSDQNTHGTKINQVFEDVSKTLHYIMCGYMIPDDQLFTEKLRNSVTLFLKSLKDPSLPLLELKV